MAGKIEEIAKKVNIQLLKIEDHRLHLTLPILAHISFD